MSEVRLSSSLPKGESDGLGPLVKQAIAEPETVHTVIMLLDTRKVITDCDDGSTVPVLRVRRAEVIRGGGDLKDAERLIRRAIERRTGQIQLDLEVETELEQMFKNIDLKDDEQPKPIGHSDEGDTNDEDQE